MKRNIIFTLAAATLLTACASTAESVAEHKAYDLPSWVLSPSVTDGLAASSCVNATNNFNIDKRHAEAGARNSLAQSINVKASVMDRTYSRMNNSAEGTQTGETFESVAKSVSDVRMVGAQIVNVDTGLINGQTQICAMAAIPEELVKGIFSDIVTASGEVIDPTNEAAMYEEFRTQKALDSLEEELLRLTQ
ncbi:hypothetical protein [Thaumasiovibrio sp. DFM-14]|uniref:hypothetical protein n=1 Tax=Thaumasiovibrio sp. DFM-14 TaxID=3384792 RepID=UPI0039A2EC28